MLKLLFTVFLGVFFVAAFAQKKTDTLVYYLNNSEEVTTVKDSADYYLLIMPPDTTVDKKLYVVKEFYRDGKLRLAGNSSTRSLDSLNKLKLQGPQIMFFENGHKMRRTNFNEGIPFGDQIFYYPNGKLYCIKTYGDNGKLSLTKCIDTAGNMIAENGNGRWIIFDENFKSIYSEGSINNGVQDGLWNEKINDSVKCEKKFSHGHIISSKAVRKIEPSGLIYTMVNQMPDFPGGIELFYRFISRNLRYPAVARENGTRGIVIINFVVEKDGTLSTIKVWKGIGDGCDEEAANVVSSSPLWIPGKQQGRPVRVMTSAKVAFLLNQ
jgi:TonB family protein